MRCISTHKWIWNRLCGRRVMRRHTAPLLLTSYLATAARTSWFPQVFPPRPTPRSSSGYPASTLCHWTCKSTYVSYRHFQKRPMILAWKHSMWTLLVILIGQKILYCHVTGKVVVYWWSVWETFVIGWHVCRLVLSLVTAGRVRCRLVWRGSLLTPLVEWWWRVMRCSSEMIH